MSNPSNESRAALAWDRDERGWLAWGTPVEPAWWQAEGERGATRLAELVALANYDDHEGGGPGCMAGLIAAAIQEVRSWKALGIPIAGRRWADLGGGRGYYAVALLLEGAAAVTVVDLEAADPWAAPILDAVGVSYVQGDVCATPVADADAALLFGVLVGVDEVAAVSSSLRMVLTSNEESAEFVATDDPGWSVVTYTYEDVWFAMSDGVAVPGYDGRFRTNTLWVARGENSFVGRAMFDEEPEDTSAPEGPSPLPGSAVSTDDDDGIPF